MYAFNFPEMVGSSTANLLKDKEAVQSALLLLLESERNTLFGDPYYGVTLRKAFFENSSSLIVDLLIDEIYTSIVTFIPQIFVQRKNIKIYTDKTDLFAQVEYIYLEDNSSNMYTINLTATDN